MGWAFFAPLDLDEGEEGKANPRANPVGCDVQQEKFVPFFPLGFSNLVKLCGYWLVGFGGWVLGLVASVNSFTLFSFVHAVLHAPAKSGYIS